MPEPRADAEADRRRQRAAAHIHELMHGLTGNLLRVVRGGGNPKELTMEIVAVAAAIVAFQRDYGQFPDPDGIAQALLVELYDEQALASMSDEGATQAEAEQDIVDGALAIVAARLLGDSAQETKGRAKMSKGAKTLKGGRPAA